MGKKEYKGVLKPLVLCDLGLYWAVITKSWFSGKNVFQCLYTLCGSVHELSDFKKLVPCLQCKPFRYPSTFFKRVGQSHLKNL